MTNLHYQLEYSKAELQTLQPIILAVFGSVD